MKDKGPALVTMMPHESDLIFEHVTRIIIILDRYTSIKNSYVPNMYSAAASCQLTDV